MHMCEHTCMHMHARPVQGVLPRDEDGGDAAAAEQAALRAMWCAAPYSQQPSSLPRAVEAAATVASIIDHAAQVRDGN